LARMFASKNPRGADRVTAVLRNWISVASTSSRNTSCSRNRRELNVELFSATSMMSVGVASWRLWKDVPMFTGVGSLSGMGETSMIGFLLALLIGVVAGLRAMTAPAVISWATNLGWHHVGAGAGRPDRAGSLGAQRGVGGPECVSPPHVRAKRRRGRRVLIGTSFEPSLVGLLAGVEARGSAIAVDCLPRPDQ
jgi:hypothetical protein